jgi:threonyl-tRNA synthetase
MAAFPISTIRHSAAHVLAQAVQVLFPQVKLAIGPAIDTGFYYDFELDQPLVESDLARIQVEIDRIISENQPFASYTMAADAAITYFSERQQPYKVAIIEDLKVSEVSIYENGPFVDLCRGPHVNHTGQIGAVALVNVSGAYWRGSEKNTMLQRVYGTAFSTKKELKQYLQQREEAKKRDHRVLGKALQLFSINDQVGSGLVLWHPKGAAVRHVIETYWRNTHLRSGYQLVHSPHIGREDLWKTSGHLDFYEDSMFSAIEIDHTAYYPKPMNCPFHIAIYQQQQVSYRDLPIRYAELGTVYRYERSGVLHGLMRVRGFTQDDAHIFCSQEQVQSEVVRALNFSLDMLGTFGFTDYAVYVSTKPAEKYVGNAADWLVAESALKDAVTQRGLPFEIDAGGGAFYGPKIDIKIKDAIGRYWQCSTIQFDFNLPTKFDMHYINDQGEKKRPYMIHRALLGSIERFFGILVEHYAGKFPVWLAPIQVRLIPLTESARRWAADACQTIIQNDLRADVDASSDTLGYKIRKAQLEKIPIVGIIGENELQNQKITLRFRDVSKQSIVSLSELIQRIQDNTIGGL